MTIPLTVIGGFLGAGKTTLVNHLMRSATRRYGVLVNDFGAVAFITAAGGDILNGRSDNNAIITSGGADLSAGGNVGSATSRAGNLTGRTGYRYSYGITHWFIS